MRTNIPSRLFRQNCQRRLKKSHLACCALVCFCLVAYQFRQRSIHDTTETITSSVENHLQGHPPYNASKVALLIESRTKPILASLLIHFISVVPPDWHFRFMGSAESIEFVNRSQAIRAQVGIGKLDLTLIPNNVSTGGQEEISQFLTSLWLYEHVLKSVEWLLIFQVDSMLCANSRQDLNNYLDYDWVGAPWHPEARFGGNGGLSLRRVSKIIQILRHEQRIPFSEPEDVWLTDRLQHLPDSKLANRTIALSFSGERYAGEKEKIGRGPNSLKAGQLIKGIDDWRVGFYEPMGYHTGINGDTFHGDIWGTYELRQHIWSYCPEIKMIFDMDIAQFSPSTCDGDKNEPNSVKMISKRNQM